MESDDVDMPNLEENISYEDDEFHQENSFQKEQHLPKVFHNIC